MTQEACNCIICAKEFNPDELVSVALSKINVTKFKICKECFENSDPANDYKQAREVVDSYLKLIEAKTSFKEVREIINSVEK